jgi:hypothetical protein
MQEIKVEYLNKKNDWEHQEPFDSVVDLIFQRLSAGLASLGTSHIKSLLCIAHSYYCYLLVQWNDEKSSKIVNNNSNNVFIGASVILV